ncbi:MaoC family dehydratase [Rhodococcus opacus]|uniref:MaoC family dehydratase n=1 Tax=Rhodococcus opacus TaxID=37919 RepID=UPI001F53E5CE|nr:MaoC/PaaZ C-terminal domain-containing protein [Rhodococcus opacus]
MISTHFENIRVGDTTTTESRTITEEYVRDFAELTWDRHPLHLNPEYAQQTRFGRQIAHGALMLSTLLGLVELHPVICNASTASTRSGSTPRRSSVMLCTPLPRSSRSDHDPTVRPR